MMKKKNIYIITLLFFLLSSVGFTAGAQEINCKVSVIAPQVQSVNRQVFNSLQNSIQEFINSRKWTEDVYGVGEKIECNILINITESNGTDYSGSLQISTSRPVYGTSYNSPILNIFDKNFKFNYIEFQPLEFQEGAYISELTAVLSYYVYTALGYDYDTYSQLGGTKYFLRAQTIVNAAQSSTFQGWQATEKNDNRFHLIDQILDERNSNFRKAMYVYHRQGMDIMANDIEKGLEHTLTSLETIRDINKNRPNLYITRQFFDAKGKELADLFSQAGATQKYRAKEMLTRLDLSNITLYNEKLK